MVLCRGGGRLRRREGERLQPAPARPHPGRRPQGAAGPPTPRLQPLCTRCTPPPACQPLRRTRGSLPGGAPRIFWRGGGASGGRARLGLDRAVSGMECGGAGRVILCAPGGPAGACRVASRRQLRMLSCHSVLPRRRHRPPKPDAAARRGCGVPAAANWTSTHPETPTPGTGMAPAAADPQQAAAARVQVLGGHLGVGRGERRPGCPAGAGASATVGRPRGAAATPAGPPSRACRPGQR